MTVARGHVYHYLDSIRDMVEDLGVPCGKWHNQVQTIATNNNFAWPILLFNARERDDSAVSNERKKFRATQQYINLANNSAAQDQVMMHLKAQVLTGRYVSGESLRATAITLGHIETNGAFRWEEANVQNQKARFTFGTDCLYCGLSGHDVPQCHHFLSRYKSRHGHDYRREAASSFGTIQRSHTPLDDDHKNVGVNTSAEVDMACNEALLLPAKGFPVQGVFTGFAIPQADGQSLVIQIGNGILSTGYGKIDISGLSLTKTSK